MGEGDYGTQSHAAEPYSCLQLCFFELTMGFRPQFFSIQQFFKRKNYFGLNIFRFSSDLTNIFNKQGPCQTKKLEQCTN